MATALDHAYMQECVTGTVGKLDEAKAFIRVVPLYNGSNGRAGGAIKLWTARRRGSEVAGGRLIVVVGEITAAGGSKISVSVAHGTFSRVSN
jgi:hypothetical protein